MWGKRVEEATEDRIKVTLFAGNTLSPPMQAYNNTGKGVVDIAGFLLTKGVIPFRTALVAALILIFIFPDIATWLPAQSR